MRHRISGVLARASALVVVLGIVASAQSRDVSLATAQRSVLLAALGPDLTRYELQLQPPALVKRESVTLPGAVQYAWPHPSSRYLYVVWANGPRDHPNGVSAFAVDPATGSLRLS